MSGYVRPSSNGAGTSRSTGRSPPNVRGRDAGVLEHATSGSTTRAHRSFTGCMLAYGVATLARHGPPKTAPMRQVVAAAIALVVLGGVGAVKAGLAGGDFMFDLEIAKPALAK